MVQRRTTRKTQANLERNSTQMEEDEIKTEPMYLNIVKIEIVNLYNN